MMLAESAGVVEGVKAALTTAPCDAAEFAVSGVAAPSLAWSSK